MTHNFRFRISAFILLCIAAFSAPARAAELKAKTTAAFDRYVSATEARFANELRPDGPFLYVDAMNAEAKQQAYDQLKRGEVLVEKLQTKAPGVSSEVPDGMVHHWVGLIFIPGVTLAQTLLLVKDYDRRAELYKPDVIASRTVAHNGDDFKMFLRLRQKKFATVVFNTYYADKPEGEELPVGAGHGYLWPLNTYWRFEEKDGGVFLQCEALSLTRDMPAGLGWLLKPLVTSIPKASLNRALGQTRKVVQDEAKSCCKSAQAR